MVSFGAGFAIQAIFPLPKSLVLEKPSQASYITLTLDGLRDGARLGTSDEYPVYWELDSEYRYLLP
jgi:hypothetical protein